MSVGTTSGGTAVQAWLLPLESAVLPADGCCHVTVGKKIFRFVSAEPGIPGGADIVLDEVQEDFHFGGEPGGSGVESAKRNWVGVPGGKNRREYLLHLWPSCHPQGQNRDTGTLRGEFEVHTGIASYNLKGDLRDHNPGAPGQSPN